MEEIKNKENFLKLIRGVYADLLNEESKKFLIRASENPKTVEEVKKSMEKNPLETHEDYIQYVAAELILKLANEPPKKNRGKKMPLSAENQNKVLKDPFLLSVEGKELLIKNMFGDLEGIEGICDTKNGQENSFKYRTDWIKETIRIESELYKMEKEDVKNITDLYLMMSVDEYFPQNTQEFTAEQFFQRLNLGGNHRILDKNRKNHIEKMNSMLETMEKFSGVRVRLEKPKLDKFYEVQLIPAYKIEGKASDSMDFKIKIGREFSMLAYFLPEGRIREKKLYPVAAPGKRGAKKELVINYIEGRITEKIRNNEKVNNTILLKNLLDVYSSNSPSAKKRVLEITENYFKELQVRGAIKSYKIEKEKILFFK